MYDLILVPTDGSEAAQDALEHALEQARAHGARVVALAVVEMSGSGAPAARDDEAVAERRERRRAELESTVTDTTDVEVERIVEVGVPSRVIVEVAARRGADLVVMSTHARSGVGRFLYGSVTEQVIRDGDVPVLAIQR